MSFKITIEAGPYTASTELAGAKGNAFAQVLFKQLKAEGEPVSKSAHVLIRAVRALFHRLHHEAISAAAEAATAPEVEAELAAMVAELTAVVTEADARVLRQVAVRRTLANKTARIEAAREALGESSDV